MTKEESSTTEDMEDTEASDITKSEVEPMFEQEVANDDSGAIKQEFLILAQYVKDLSFENHMAPNPLPQDANPKMEIHVDLKADNLSSTDYAIHFFLVLRMNSEEGLVFLIDIQYTGIIRLSGFKEELIEPLLFIEGPRHLFPYIRSIISDITVSGGLQPLMIDPIDFADLYYRRKAEKEKEKETNEEGNTSTDDSDSGGDKSTITRDFLED